MSRNPGRVIRLLAVLAVCAATTHSTFAFPPDRRARSTAVDALPERLTDAEFWTLVSEISEPGGYFRITDNYTSNEREIGPIVTMIRERGLTGGAYIGVGPEQNFTYMAALRPAIAFIIDIRRQAVMQHLMFKALFEIARDRADFISLLFARPRPASLSADTSIQAMWTAFDAVAPDEAAGRRNAARIVERLTGTHHFALTTEEVESIRAVYDAFVAFGPEISTRGGNTGGFGGGRGGRGGTFELLTGYTTDASGTPQSFLSTEANFAIVKALQEKNLVVPVSGDFGGPKALRAIGAYLRAHDTVVGAYYVSNVEQYLFQDGKADVFYANVRTLPLDSRSVFIRPYAYRNIGTPEVTLCTADRFLIAATAGRVRTNSDALACAN